MFEQSFVNREPRPGRKASIVVSFLMQFAMVLGLVMLPMVFFEELPGVVLAATLISPEPPPPLPKHVAVIKAPPELIRQFDGTRLFAPKDVPKEVALIVEEAPPELTGPRGAESPYAVGVPDGWNTSGLSAPVAPPPPAPVEPKPVAVQRFRVGGDVKPPSQVSAAQPVYPRIAIQTHTQGEVRIEAVIGVDGHVHDVKPLSGHPLLVPAAMEAVRRWVYQPTTLNGNPVEVVMIVTVNFRLTR